MKKELQKHSCYAGLNSQVYSVLNVLVGMKDSNVKYLNKLTWLRAKTKQLKTSASWVEKFTKIFIFFVLARSQVNLLMYLTVEYYFPTSTK